MSMNPLADDAKYKEQVVGSVSIYHRDPIQHAAKSPSVLQRSEQKILENCTLTRYAMMVCPAL
jgi:hypothetical protein